MAWTAAGEMHGGERHDGGCAGAAETEAPSEGLASTAAGPDDPLRDDESDVCLPSSVDGRLTNVTYGNGVLVVAMPRTRPGGRPVAADSVSRPCRQREASTSGTSAACRGP
jgi:hypothetical protein